MTPTPSRVAPTVTCQPGPLFARRIHLALPDLAGNCAPIGRSEDAVTREWAGTMASVERCQVMIAGAGPVGTVMATLLARAGIDVIVLEAGEDCAQDMRAS
ncbi:MAG: FAD-dependent monooxygenase, partial [Novosphingobium sp.]